MATSAQERLNSALAAKDDKRILAARLEMPPLLEFIKSVAPQLEPLGVVRVAYGHVTRTPALSKCSVQSVVTGVCEAAQLGLTIDGVLGLAYLVPFARQAKMMLGYRGIETLAYRSGAVKRFHADTVHEGDLFEYEEGVNVHLRHQRPPLGEERGAVIGAYATAHLASDIPPLVVVHDLQEIHRRRSFSKSYKNNPQDSPWGLHFPQMARKGPIRDMGKLIPYQQLQMAAIRDEARDEGVADNDPVDLGVADVVAETVHSNPEPCKKCGRRDVNADGSCPDCEPNTEA